MSSLRLPGLLICFQLFLLAACNTRKLNANSFEGSAKTSGYEDATLPPPYATGSSKNFSQVIGWKAMKNQQLHPDLL